MSASDPKKPKPPKKKPGRPEERLVVAPEDAEAVLRELLKPKPEQRGDGEQDDEKPKDRKG
jgi:hypothetical protein